MYATLSYWLCHILCYFQPITVYVLICGYWYYVVTETIAYISSKLQHGALTYNEERVAVFGNVSTPFVMHRPGLTYGASTVSIMSLDKPGWYLRHFGGSVYLEPKVNPRDPSAFDIDATFYERKRVFRRIRCVCVG